MVYAASQICGLQLSYSAFRRERNDLAEILALLKTQIDPSLLTKKEGEEGTQDENGNVVDRMKNVVCPNEKFLSSFKCR